jgi:hypothetical protein
MKVKYAILLVGMFSCGALHGATLTSYGPKGRSESGWKQPESSPNIVYISPLPGSNYITPSSNIILRADVHLSPNTTQDGLFNVVGSSSGKHDGKVILADDQQTVLFQPETPFALGESVSVSMTHYLLSVEGDTIFLNPFSFAVSGANLNADKPFIEEISKAFSEAPTAGAHIQPSVNRTKSVPKETQLKDELEGLPGNFPPLTVTAYDSPSAGYIFLSTFNSPDDSSYGHYLIIADNSGNPVFYKHLSDQAANQAWDFTLQPTGVLSYAYPFTDPTWYVMNTSFQVIDSFRCGNGYVDDGHDMKILPNGNIILLADDYEQVDMSKIIKGGDTDATVLDCVIQELDKNKNVIFQWRAIDHFNMTDGLGTTLTGASVDPFHCNAIEMDQDGNILLSTRYLSEITKIDIETGNIIWRLGGINNQFDFVNDTTGFSWQHDIIRLPNGDITLMDNGNQHDPPFSRAVEYKLDEIDKTATLVWQFRHTPDVSNPFTGSVQRLTDGNTLIGWGGAPTPTLTEVRPDGSTALEMAFPYDAVVSYRDYCFPFLIVTSPTSNDTVRAGNIATLKWKSSGVDTVDIDYSTDGGNSWVSEATNYPADKDSLSVSIPTGTSSPLKFRVIESGEWDKGVAFVSDPIAVSDIESVKSSPNSYSYFLADNYPNPFNPSTIINYEVASSKFVTLKVYDVLGREIETLVNETKGPGQYSVAFDGSKLSSGVYFYRMTAGNYVSTKKALLVK